MGYGDPDPSGHGPVSNFDNPTQRYYDNSGRRTEAGIDFENSVRDNMAARGTGGRYMSAGAGGDSLSFGTKAVILFFIIFYGGMYYGWIPWSLMGFLGSVVLAMIAAKTSRIWGMALIIGSVAYSAYTWWPTIKEYSPISVRFAPEEPVKAPVAQPPGKTKTQ